MRDALLLLGERPARIIETGSSAWGTDSSRLFDAYVATFGGEFTTVDVRSEPMRVLRHTMTLRSSMVVDDSVQFLKRWTASHVDQQVDLVYLDSCDLDPADPVPSALHGLREFLAVSPALRPGSILLIDDTPADPRLLPEAQWAAAEEFRDKFRLVPGKGMLVDLYLGVRDDVEKVHHGYQVLYRFL